VRPYINVTQFKWGLLKILSWLLLRDICHYTLWKALNEMNDVTYLWSINFLCTNNLFVNTFLLCYNKPSKFMLLLLLVSVQYDNNISFLNVKVKLWHVCFGHQFHWLKLISLSHFFEPFEAPNTSSITFVKQVKF
jgi:hypothetical protein